MCFKPGGGLNCLCKSVSVTCISIIFLCLYQSICVPLWNGMEWNNRPTNAVRERGWIIVGSDKVDSGWWCRWIRLRGKMGRNLKELWIRVLVTVRRLLIFLLPFVENELGKVDLHPRDLHILPVDHRGLDGEQVVGRLLQLLHLLADRLVAGRLHCEGLFPDLSRRLHLHLWHDQSPNLESAHLPCLCPCLDRIPLAKEENEKIMRRDLPWRISFQGQEILPGHRPHLPDRMRHSPESVPESVLKEPAHPSVLLLIEDLWWKHMSLSLLPPPPLSHEAFQPLQVDRIRMG